MRVVYKEGPKRTMQDEKYIYNIYNKVEICKHKNRCNT